MVATRLPYPIVLAPGAIDRLASVVSDVGPRNRVLVITDRTVAALYGQRVADLLGTVSFCGVLAFDISEATKTRATWATITDALLDRRLGRDTTLVALGGGVVGDVVGFVAATYMRGIPFVQVPTTLLAMVDASVGGKTGVDTPHGKNLVGAFHQPGAVVIDPVLLETLPPQQYRAGFAEIIKHGVIADAGYFAATEEFLHRPLSSGGARRWGDIAPLVERSVQIKADVVARDEREAGARKILNFGHTIAHAVEAATNYGVLHGEAVSVGMVVEARLAERIGVADRGTADAVTRACAAAGLPTTLPQVDPSAVLSYAQSDKKARGGRVEYALPARVGEMAGRSTGWGVAVDDTVVTEVLRS